MLKGDVERLPLFRIFLEEEEEEDDGDSNVIAGPQAGVHNAQEGHHDGREREEDEAQRSNPVKDVRKDVRVTEQASPELASSSSFSSVRPRVGFLRWWWLIADQWWLVSAGRDKSALCASGPARIPRPTCTSWWPAIGATRRVRR